MAHRIRHNKAATFGLISLCLIFTLVCAGTSYSEPLAGKPFPPPTPTGCLPATTTQYEPFQIIYQEFPARGPSETAWVVVWSENGHKGLWIAGAWFWRKPPFTWSNVIQVLGQAGLSNIFVPYHSGYPRTYDMKFGELLAAIPQDAGDCGTITDPLVSSPMGNPPRRVLIKEIRDRGVAWTSDRHTRRGEEMLLWATYDAGNYENIIQYGFRDDGTVTFRLGSTGYNSVVRPFTAHMHNSLWYVDINVGDPDHNSVMLMKHIEPSDPGNPNDPNDPNNPCLLNPSAVLTASDCMQPFNNGVEGFADWNDKEFTHLNILNTQVKNAQGHNISYDFMPMRTGTARHFEDPFRHDFWVTQQNSGELEYDYGFDGSNGAPYITPPKSIMNQDVALWYFSSNHHLPRDEDHEYAQPIRLPGAALVMWSGFDLQPRNLFNDTPLHEPPCALVPPNLVGWWPMDEVTNAIAIRALTANGTPDFPRNGIAKPAAVGVSNGPSPVPGVVGGAIKFDGVDDYVEIPDQPSLNFGTTNFSIDAWVRTTQNNGVAVILDKRRGPPYQGYHLFTSDGTLFLQLASGGTFQNYSSTAFIADGNWHHIAVIVDQMNFQITWYIDGIAKPPIPSPPLDLDNFAPLRLGARSFSLSGYWNGELDELEIFNRALTDLEVLAIFAAGRNGKCSKP